VDRRITDPPQSTSPLPESPGLRRAAARPPTKPATAAENRDSTARFPAPWSILQQFRP